MANTPSDSTDTPTAPPPSNEAAPDPGPDTSSGSARQRRRQLPYGFAVGIPTRVDVERLIATFGEPAVGRLITYGEIETVLHLTHTAVRFKTVVSAWRRRLERDYNLLLFAVPNQGLQVADNHERVDLSASKARSGTRAISVGARWAIRTSRLGLEADEARSLDHVVQLGASVQLAAALTARKMRELPLVEGE